MISLYIKLILRVNEKYTQFSSKCVKCYHIVPKHSLNIQDSDQWSFGNFNLHEEAQVSSWKKLNT